MILRYTMWFEPGDFVGGNMRVRSTKQGRKYITKEGKQQDLFFAMVANKQTIAQGWVIPDFVSYRYTLYNLDTDLDNAEKVINDPLEGIVFRNDRYVKQKFVQARKDKHGPRIDLVFRAIDGKRLGFPKPSKPKGRV